MQIDMQVLFRLASGKGGEIVCKTLNITVKRDTSHADSLDSRRQNTNKPQNGDGLRPRRCFHYRIEKAS
jgi:hypothetical protein